MQRYRVLVVFGIAWLSALGLSWWVFKQGASQPARDVVSAVAAAKDLPIGSRLTAADLKTVTVERKDLPRSAFLKISDVVDRSVLTPLKASELVLDGKLAAKGGGSGLTALIEPNSRAISVQVNEVSGVSGFIQPGSRVDVFFTRVFGNGDAATTMILQNVKVLAYGRQIDPLTRGADNTRPTVATLLVSPDDAARVVLAQQRGRLQLVLRNPLDEEIADEFEPVQPADLGIEEPQKRPAVPVRPTPVIEPRPAPPPPPVPAPAKSVKPQNEGRVVRIYRGDKVVEERFP